jgi:hypothetical protein
VADQYDVPLVVAVGAHRFTGVDLDDVDDMLSGQRTVSFQFGASDSYIGTASITEPWTMPERLSGLLWLNNREPFGATARPNPHARRPMPAAIARLDAA